MPFTGNTLSLTQLGVEMEDNVEVLIGLELTCYACSYEETTLVQQTKWVRYMGGALVQDVWGKSSVSFREKMIGARTGTWLCDDCWSIFFEDDDED